MNYELVINLIPYCVFFEVNLLAKDDTLLSINFKWQALKRVQGGDQGIMMTMVIAYERVFGENSEPLESYGILGSWEVDSNLGLYKGLEPPC
jgi:hypothetical protein